MGGAGGIHPTLDRTNGVWVPASLAALEAPDPTLLKKPSPMGADDESRYAALPIASVATQAFTDEGESVAPGCGSSRQ